MNKRLSRQYTHKASLLVLLMMMPLMMMAQISGVVLDASDGGPMPRYNTKETVYPPSLMARDASA